MLKKVLKIVVRMFGFLLASLLIGYGVFLVNAKFVLHEPLPMLGGIGQAIVLSGSMEPEISVNDLLIIQKCGNYDEGDIITYIDAKNTLVTHRIIKIDGTEITAKGDANNTCDPVFEEERIKGKVIAIIPKAGYVMNIIQNPMCIFVIIVVTFILAERSYRKEQKKKNQNIENLKAEIEALKQKKTSETDIKNNEDEKDALP